MRTSWLIWMGIALAMATPAHAQMQTVDPNDVIDGDLDGSRALPPRSAPAPATPAPVESPPPAAGTGLPAPDTSVSGAAPAGSTLASPTATASTYQREDLINAAEGVFGKGAEGLAGIVENILRDQGEPNAYIAGREVSGAFVLGLRYGSGLMQHKVEGERPVFWTGPSVGFDVGGDAAKVFVLVYNLYDSQELYRRYPAAEGRVYFVGGFAATYMRRGDVVLIPIRLGVGWRLAANVGYMKFSEKSRLLPF